MGPYTAETHIDGGWRVAGPGRAFNRRHPATRGANQFPTKLMAERVAELANEAHAEGIAQCQRVVRAALGIAEG